VLAASPSTQRRKGASASKTSATWLRVEEDVYICPAGERLPYRYTNEENGLVLGRYWTNACESCAIRPIWLWAINECSCR
jgi:hypothetical protein